MQMAPRNLPPTALGVIIGVALCIPLVALLPGGVARASAPCYEITALVSPLEGGNVLGEGIYHEGESVCLTAIAAHGFRFEEWTEDGEPVSRQPEYCFQASTGRVMTARFVPDDPSFGVSGQSRGWMRILPDLSFGNRLELRLAPRETSERWTVRVAGAFSDSSWSRLQVDCSGWLGDIQANAALRFTPSAAAYSSGFVALLWRGTGLTLGLRVNHSLTGGDPTGSRLLYSWTLRAAPLSLTARFNQHENGIEFRDIRAHMTGIEICCGIVGRGVLSLTKEGFDYLHISLANLIQLNRGISMDFDVRYGLDVKEVTLTPHWKVCGGPCITVYGGIARQETFSLSSIELYGFSILCCLEDRCPPGSLLSSPYLELAIALDSDNARRVPVGFRGQEFGYAGMGVCGPACCEGAYSLELGAYFQSEGQLFGLSRWVIDGALPILPGLLLTSDLEISAEGGITKLEVGWRWGF